MDQNRVYFFDTTLRDGEQTPGVSLQTPEKVEIAKGLVRLGIDVIEAGFPAASPGDFEAVQTIAREVKGATICALARANEKDVQKAIDALKDAERSRLHVFIAISELHMEYKLKMTRQEVLDKVNPYWHMQKVRLMKSSSPVKMRHALIQISHAKYLVLPLLVVQQLLMYQTQQVT